MVLKSLLTRAVRISFLSSFDTNLINLFTKNGNKVKTGSFWDFKKKAPRETPEVVFIFRDLRGEVVEVPDGVEVPIEVKAAQISEKNKKAKKVKKVKEENDEE